MVIDEQLVGYRPSTEKQKKQIEQGNPIPIIHIPRKPNSTGLLIYQVLLIVFYFFFKFQLISYRQNKHLLEIIVGYNSGISNQ